ncbi:MAG: dipeptidase [Actinomycetota bacterium]
MTDADMALPPARVDTLRAAITDAAPSIRRDLESLIRFPGVSAVGVDHPDLHASARAVAKLLRDNGLHQVEILAEEGAPAVVGHLPPPPGAPTVLLYAHHDVQPPGPLHEWTSPPFEPQVRAGRLYGRGSADDKAGIMVHLAAIRAHGGRPPCGVTVFIEGEEEIGSPSLRSFLAAHQDRLAADVVVLADSMNWRVGVPALTTSLRGLVEIVVEVTTAERSVHSGLVGGPAPDAVMALIRLLSTVHDDAGDVAIPGLQCTEASDVGLTEADFRADAALVAGVELIGTGSLTSRLWGRPALTVVGFDSPGVDLAANVLTPRARAKLSLRVAPSQDVESAYQAVRHHLLSHVPWGVQVVVSPLELASGFAADATGPVYDAARSSFADAWGVPPVNIGIGGTIPFVAAFSRAFPHAPIVVTGVEDPSTQAHGVDESLHLGEFDRACLAEALFLERLGVLGL